MPDGDHAKVIERELGASAPALARGPFVRRDGTVLGHHEGYARFTVGQRRGLPGGFAEPMFVVAIEPDARAVVIGPREELLGRGVVAREVNWLVDAPQPGDEVEVQVRHRASPAKGTILRRDADEVELVLDVPVAAIAPGQSLVLYRGDVVLGGGVIERAATTRAALPILAA